MLQNRLQSWLEQVSGQFQSELQHQQKHMQHTQQELQKQIQRQHEMAEQQKELRKNLQALYTEAQQQTEKLRDDLGKRVQQESKRVQRRFGRHIHAIEKQLDPQQRKSPWMMWAVGLLAIGGIGYAVGREVKRNRHLRNSLKTDAGFDIKKMVGKWFEIAHLGSTLKSPYGLTVNYTLSADGHLEAHRQWAEGGAEGIEREEKMLLQLRDSKQPARLEQHIKGPLNRPYWVLEHGQNYDYVVLGNPNRKQIWILSRHPQLDDDTYHDIMQRLQEQGFDTRKVMQVEQDPNAPLALNTHLHDMLAKKKAYYQDEQKHQKHLGPNANKRNHHL